MKKRRSPISVKLAHISGLFFSRPEGTRFITHLGLIAICALSRYVRLRRKNRFRMEEEVLVGFDAVGHSGNYIQSVVSTPFAALTSCHSLTLGKNRHIDIIDYPVAVAIFYIYVA